MLDRLIASAPIGVFDSGVGGLSVLRAARAELPHENFIYFADSGYAPYGDKSDAYVSERSERIGAWLVEQDVKAIVVACNTATAIAVQALRAKFTLPIVGVEPGLKPAASVTRSGKVGVLATARTLASPRYAALLDRVQSSAPNATFIARVGEGWVEAVERGEFESPSTLLLVSREITPLLDQGCDTLVLGCTHYPFLTAAIRTAAPAVTIIDTAPAIARELKRRIASESAFNGGLTSGSLRITATGDNVRVSNVAKAMLREDITATNIEECASRAWNVEET
jgi:glutamate racemase